jgi:hypothetical protein
MKVTSDVNDDSWFNVRMCTSTGGQKTCFETRQLQVWGLDPQTGKLSRLKRVGGYLKHLQGQCIKQATTFSFYSVPNSSSDNVLILRAV